MARLTLTAINAAIASANLEVYKGADDFFYFKTVDGAEVMELPDVVTVTKLSELTLDQWLAAAGIAKPAPQEMAKEPAPADAVGEGAIAAPDAKEAKPAGQKLNYDIADEVRKYRAIPNEAGDGPAHSHLQVGQHFGISAGRVSQICRNLTFKDVTYQPVWDGHRDLGPRNKSDAEVAPMEAPVAEQPQPQEAAAQ